MPNLTALTVQLGGSMSVNASGTQPSNGNITGVTQSLPATQNNGFTFALNLGTGSGNASNITYQARVLAAGACETLIISSGLPDMYGNSGANVGFSIVRTVFYLAVANPDNSNSSTGMVIGNAANPFPNFLGSGTQTVRIVPGGPAYMNGNNAGAPVVASTSDGVKITNIDGGNTLTYVVGIAGE